jgi:hypothetical protein
VNSRHTGAGAVLQLAGRLALILMAAAGVAWLAFLRVGPPSLGRLYRQNEIARFAPTADHGVGQLLGEGLLLVLFAYAGRRWLWIRL